MEHEMSIQETAGAAVKAPEVYYKKEKDFYKGLGGELRFKAEGLFKKAKEKGISIEDISISTIRDNRIEFPGIGVTELPAYMVKVVGRDTGSGQTIVDGKQIDYFNIYQSYLAEKIESKNVLKDESGKLIRENSKPKLKNGMEFFLTEIERFDIGRKLIDDKEFGLEKTITGACDRVIRKLMGENDWMYPEEAKMLEDEFNKVQNQIAAEKGTSSQAVPETPKKATDRQINYLKARVKNAGMDPESDSVIKELLRQSGLKAADPAELSTNEMSRVIENFNTIVPRLKEILTEQGDAGHAEAKESRSMGKDGRK